MLTQFVPLAVTKANNEEACVGAVAENGEWVRPEPIAVEEVQADAAPYRYFWWTAADLGPSRAVDCRPEDRDLRRNPQTPCVLSDRPPEDRATFLSRHLDADVETAFSGTRSLGLVRVRVCRLYAKRSTGGRLFFRAEFSDGSASTFDWIIPELAFSREVEPFVIDGELDTSFASHLVALFDRRPTYFAVGLTKPNHRFPGRFRGCHPLVVGIHTVPDYRAFSLR